LLDLATHTAGFPVNPDNMSGASVKKQYETHTVEKMYSFLSGYILSRDPGTEFEYSNLGMSLLGHMIALKAGTNFEALVIDRICRPLHMDSTRITLTPELKSRLAMGHESSGKRSLPWNLQVYAPAGAVHSTANDLLKYMSANARLTRSKLTPLMEKTHVIRFKDSHGLPGNADKALFGRTAMAWVDRGFYQPPGMELLGHAGGAGSYHAWIGFDKKQQRGVVVLSTANDLTVETIGWRILQRAPLAGRDPKTIVPMQEFVGSGMAYEMDKAGTLRIKDIFPNTSASDAGLTRGLIVQRINGVLTQGKTLAECVKHRQRTR